MGEGILMVDSDITLMLHNNQNYQNYFNPSRIELLAY